MPIKVGPDLSTQAKVGSEEHNEYLRRIKKVVVDDGNFVNLTASGDLGVEGNIKLGGSSSNTITFKAANWTLTNNVTVTGTWADLGTVTTVQITTLELGAASDTSITRVSAGEIAVEGTQLAKLDGNLQDLDTLGASAADNEFIVATSAGVFAYETGTVVRTSIGISPLAGTTDSITAGDTQTQAGATALTTYINRVTTSGLDGDGVKLPTAVGTQEILIINDDAAQTIQIWPFSGDAIDGGSVDAADVNTLAAGASRRYIDTDTTNWYTA